MTGKELIRKLRRLGRHRGLEVRFEAHRGKGDHGKLWYGERWTTLGDQGELKTGTLMSMLKDLGVSLDELRNT